MQPFCVVCDSWEECLKSLRFCYYCGEYVFEGYRLFRDGEEVSKVCVFCYEGGGADMPFVEECDLVEISEV